MAATKRHKEIARTLLKQYGTTFSKEIGAQVERNTPSPLYKLLVASKLAKEHKQVLDSAA